MKIRACLIAALLAGNASAGSVTAASREIDRIVDAYHARNAITPAGPASDAVFLRRVYLDLSGTIPTLEQTTRFLDSEDPDKRAELIDALLASAGFTSHFYNYWASLLRVQGRIRGMPNGAYAAWMRQAIAENMPYDRFVSQLITAEGDTGENGATGYYLRDGQMRLDTVSATAQVFLGTQIGCAQCHDHKFDKWTQKDYYQFAASMAQVNVQRPGDEIRRVRREMEDATDAKRRELRQYLNNLSSTVVDRSWKQLRLPDDYVYDNGAPGDVVQPRALFGATLAETNGLSRRDAFAKWLTDPDNPRFTTVIANRLWKKVMGVGLIEPVDDLNEYTEAVVPELMENLEKTMIAVDYDMRRFLGVLLKTQAYQRDAMMFEPGDYHVQGTALRRMRAEQAWDSVLTLVKGTLDELVPMRDRTEDMDAMQAMAPPGARRRAMRQGGVWSRRAADLPMRGRSGQMLDVFGRSNRETISEGSTDPSVPQALFLMNNPDLWRAMINWESRVSRDLRDGADDRDRIRRLYLTVLTREPSSAELERARKHVRANARGDRGYQDLLWAMVNSREFLFIQ